MNVNLYDFGFLHRLFSHSNSIAIFIYDKQYYFIIDETETFHLELEQTLKEIKSESSSQLEYEKAYADFRERKIASLKANFENYLLSETVLQLSKEQMKELLFHGFSTQEIEHLYNVVENHLTHNIKVSRQGHHSDFLKINQIASRLPLFYINFDTMDYFHYVKFDMENEYFHAYWYVSNEMYPYDDWFSTLFDFGNIIPEEFCYWKTESKDFWKFKQIEAETTENVKFTLYDDQFFDMLSQNMIAIAVFVCNEEYYFVIDDKEYFHLDMSHYEEPDLRGGILQLSKDNFENYLQLNEVIQLSQKEMSELFFHGFDKQETEYLYTVVENRLAHNIKISQQGHNNDFLKINQISSRLPLFYINFDTKEFFHMDWNRLHEESAYDDWDSKDCDFGYYIPDEFCYWKKEGKDFWKFHKIYG